MHYPTDLTDDQWKVIQPIVAGPKTYRTCLRSVINAIRYLVRTGCQWALLPKTFPPPSTVHYHLRRLIERHLLDKAMGHLTRALRTLAGRAACPSAAVVDAQSVKSTQVCPKAMCGYDGGKKVKGIKRHLATDTLGLPLEIIVHPASVGDRGGAKGLLDRMKARFADVQMVYCDGGYSWVGRSDEPLQHIGAHAVTIVKRSEAGGKAKGGGFHVVAKRWVIERTFAWIETDRRNAKCYERKPQSARAMAQLSLIRILLKRLCKQF